MTMSTIPAPRFRSLERPEIDEILARNNVGRIAFATENQVDILPVHYVFSDNWIYGRTTPGGRLDRVGEHWRPVAFEVDEIASLFDWRSVVVKGGLYIVRKEGPAWEREVWLTGVGLLRKLIPDALRDDDPVPDRTTLFRIAVQDVTGRQAIPG
jgi:uncharacterized protein